MSRQKVLVTYPADFRIEAQQRFGERQTADARAFADMLRTMGHEVHLIDQPLTDQNTAFKLVDDAVRQFHPTHVIKRCYLWADPPNGHSVTLATPQGVPIGVSGFIPVEGDPLGEAPGEVFVFHDTCNMGYTGRPGTRLWGPLSGPGSDVTTGELEQFLRDGTVVRKFPDRKLPITAAHTQRAAEINAADRGRTIAMTGNECMGMLSCKIDTPTMCGAGREGWGFNIPIIPPDLFRWDKMVKDREAYYLSLGHAYVQAMVAKGFRFRYQTDWDGSPMPWNEREFSPDVAARQMAYYAAMVDIMRKEGLHIVGVPAQLVMTDNIFCGDLIKGVAMSSWGPEGRDGEVLHLITEGDMQGGNSHSKLYRVTRNTVIFCDVRCRIPKLGPGVWKMCNSGSAGAEGAEGGYAACFSVAQYKGYFRAPGVGGTFAFLRPKITNVVGLRTAVDHRGICGTVAIGRTVHSDDRLTVVDGRWPQYNVDMFVPEDEAREGFPTNHFHWAESSDPVDHACVLHECIRLAAGGNPDDPTDKADRVQVLYDGRPIPK